MYNDQNVFAKILRKEIPAQIVYETEYALSFCDAHPQAPVHVLVIPKTLHTDFNDFHQNAASEAVIGFYKTVDETIQKLALTNGYRLITNKGEIGGQTVPHYHVHILAGKKMGAKVVTG